MAKEIAIEAEYPHPPEKVWRALTDPALLAEWLMPNDFEPRVGHAFTFRTDPAPGFDGIVHCEVLELVAPHKLSFTWRGGPLDTVATFELAATEAGCLLRFRQTGFTGTRAQIVRMILRAGSRSIYHRRLPALLDRMDGTTTTAPAEPCRKGGLWRMLAAVCSPILGRKKKSGSGH